STLEDGAVKGAGEDASVQVGRWLDNDAELDAGVPARELGKVGRDVVSGAGGAGAQVERSRLQLLGGLGRVFDDLDGPQRRTTGFGEGTARVGEADPAAVTFQQLDSHGLLEVPDLLGDRALGQKEGRGRP